MRVVTEAPRNCEIQRSAQARGSTLDDCVSLRFASSLLAVAAVNPGQGSHSNEDARCAIRHHRLSSKSMIQW